jgi:hypothetical protein
MSAWLQIAPPRKRTPKPSKEYPGTNLHCFPNPEGIEFREVQNTL